MMTRAGDGDDDEGESFYESLDRLASYSSATTSTCSSPAGISDDDDNNNSFRINSPNDAEYPVPKFPMGTSKYDIWSSVPSSIEERRIHLLRQMGLSKDPSLSRVKPVFGFDYREMTASGEFGRSVSSDQLTSIQHQAENFGAGSSMIRSKSDGSTHCCHSPLSDCRQQNSQRNSKSVYSPSILSFHSSVSETSVYVNNSINYTNLIVKPQNGEINGSPISNRTATALLNKPPTGKNSKKIDESQHDSSCSYTSTNDNTMPLIVNDSGGEFVHGANCNDVVIDQMCTIKNLDTGKEFVVNETREDGMWNKLKEVGTGKQLTMEEFEKCVGHSPIVQELMRRQNVEEGNKDNLDSNGNVNGTNKVKKKSNWFKSIKNAAGNVTGHKERKNSEERETSSDKGGRRSSSATDDSQDVIFHGPERSRVKQYGKSCKDLTALYKIQEIQAHTGSIWCIKFSLDGKYLASAGEDGLIHIWQIIECERKGDLLIERLEDSGHFNMVLLGHGSPEPTSLSPTVNGYLEKKGKGRSSISRKSISLEPVIVPETVFGLSEKPFCSFQGHHDDVLDLSWSKSQHLLSSSMDKTVRLWHLSSKSCLKIFSHGDYVTCIQFNPVDDKYFISGSLDAKVRIWSIPDTRVVHWHDLNEMVTAACYTPDGQGALVGSYKGSCRLYNTSENKLQQKSQINLQNKKKKSHQKKITGFQFAPGSSSEVLVTSADSRIRVVDGVDLVHKFKGFRNTNSQISSSVTANGQFVVSASEDSNVYVWKHEGESRPSRSKGVTVTRSYEHFHCQDVSAAIPWPGMANMWGVVQDHFNTRVEDENVNSPLPSPSACTATPLATTNGYFFDQISATWPEEKLLLAAKNRSPHVSIDFSDGLAQNRSAWGMVIVTAGLRGEIRIYQNFGLPVRI